MNTSAREGLPTTFIEAAAHRTAILSCTDPDGFASHFGRCVADSSLSEGLSWLLEQDRWRRLGEAGRDFVEACFATPVAIDAHQQAYEQAIETARRRRNR